MVTPHLRNMMIKTQNSTSSNTEIKLPWKFKKNNTKTKKSLLAARARIKLSNKIMPHQLKLVIYLRTTLPNLTL
jgi:hypothetical protein